MDFRGKNDVRNRPIGIFDSGIGGLTVMKKISEILPKENIIYFGDTARVPYGGKSRETVIKFSMQDADFLADFGVKMIVVACNTASSLSLDALKRRYDIPLMGVVEPGARCAVALTKKKKIGVIGTKATIRSGVYEREIRKISHEMSVLSVDCPLFVPLVEEGWLDGEITEGIIRKYLGPVKKYGADILVLGCTHYPLLKNAIQKVLGKEVLLVDSALETAKEVKMIVEKYNIAKDLDESPEYTFYVSDETSLFKKIGEKFLGRPIEKIQKADIELREKICTR